MKNVFVALALVILATGCKKNTNVDEVPHIELSAVFPDSLVGGDITDTVYIKFSLRDDNADLGYEQTQNINYDIYVRDMRVDTFTGYFFPALDDFIVAPENKKGIQGNAYFFVMGGFTYVREDSLHSALGDTTQYELYIKDLAGNESNHIITGPVYIKLP